MSISRRRSPRTLGVALLVCACTPVDGEPVSEVPARVDVTPAPTPAPTKVEPAPRVPEPPAIVDPGLAEIVEPGADLSPWTRIVEYTQTDFSEPNLVRIEDDTVFAALGPALVRLLPDGTALPVTTAGIEPMDERPEWLDGSLYQYGHTVIGGSGPGSSFLVVQFLVGTRGQNPAPHSYRMDQGRWRRLASSPLFDSYPRGFGRWRDGSLLALRAFVPRYAHPAEEEGETVPAREVRASAAAIAKQKQLVVISGAPKAPALKWKGTAFAMTSLPSGEILVASGTDEHASVLHYDGATGKSRVLPLPSAIDLWSETTQLTMRAADDAWLSGPYLAHFDGTQWSRVETPCAGDPYAFAVTDAHEIVACRVAVHGTERAAVLRRAHASGGHEGKWQSLGLPTTQKDVYPQALVAVGERVVVLLQEEHHPTSIWHNGPAPEQPYRFGTTSEIAAPILEAASDLPIRDHCSQIFVPFTAPQGSDHGDVLARFEDLSGTFEVATVRVRGTVVDGIVVSDLAGRRTAADVAGHIADKMGTEVGPATCNYRPPK